MARAYRTIQYAALDVPYYDIIEGVTFYILQENAFTLLQENNFALLLESAP
jgi:hypothetical protein